MKQKIFAVLVVLSALVFCGQACLPGQAQAAGVVPDVGADDILDAYFNGNAPGNTTLKLFCSNTTPADTDTNATYTECDCSGYSAKTLTQGSWTITTGNDPSDAAYAEQDFAFTGTCSTNPTVYGWYVVTATGNILVMAETLTTSQTPGNGTHIYITPKIKLSKGTPN